MELSSFNADYNTVWLTCSLTVEVPELGQPGDSSVHTIVKRVSKSSP